MSKKKRPPKIEDLAPLVCGDCQACCKRDVIFLLPEEIGKYEAEIIQGRVALAHKTNGDCHYLTPAGCGIHALKPIKCKNLDCRAVLLAVGEKTARLLGGDIMVEAAQARIKGV